MTDLLDTSPLSVLACSAMAIAAMFVGAVLLFELVRRGSEMIMRQQKHKEPAE